ncbi:hypothetical protein OH76DRAFT_1403067 [Lentinus brumalis]|uniref:F-box domain-containing protein n=1 Tax=Lentinus brumalis TaxID=2498619 RepID=A0A371DCC2_9APHY|nr:hypothetical protein OH76DRAFT_1403067 [Polyporus brumalis]
MSVYGAQHGPKGILPQLPLELVHLVATYADQPTLKQLCLVNSVVRDVAASHLYTDVRVAKPPSVVRCLRTMSEHPELAKHTHVFTIHLVVKFGRCLTDAFGRLLRRALRNMPHLVSLELELYEDALGRYLRGCPFRITNLSLRCAWDNDLAAWLGEQPAILRFIFHDHPRSSISLAPSALPKLQSIYATPAVISVVAPGRPVKQVFVVAYTRDVFSERTVERMARSCMLSTGPVSAVYVMMQGARIHPEETFNILSFIPLHLPGLVKLSMQADSYALDEVTFTSSFWERNLT